ncbi:MAG TPA: hypothetical protein VGL46_02005 [Pseudonocardiaceae bacterium]
MSLTNVWVQAMADGMLRADQIVGVTLHRTPALRGKPSRWLLDVVLPVTADSGTTEDWVTTALHRTLAQSGTEPAEAPESLVRLLAQLDATDAAGIVTINTTPTSATGLVLQRHLVECVSASAVVAESGLVLALSAPVGPVADVFDGVCVSYREVREQAAGLR